jgi:hypothetical protein
LTAAVRGPHNAISFGRLRRFIIEKRGFILAEMAVRVVAAEYIIGYMVRRVDQHKGKVTIVNSE